MENRDRIKVWAFKIIASLFVLSLLVLWCWNFPNLWLGSGKSVPAGVTPDWSDLQHDFQQTLGQATSQFSSLGNKGLATTSSSTDLAGRQIIADLLRATQATRASSSVLLATSSAHNALVSSTVIESPVKSVTSSTGTKQSICPKSIDCMPTIGKTRDCKIPLGCEGVTVIAY
jgi:hypothetical protein